MSLFLFKKIIQSAFSGSRRDRVLLIRLSVAENRHSDCAEVAGIARYFRARCAHLGNVTALRRDQSSADSSSVNENAGMRGVKLCGLRDRQQH